MHSFWVVFINRSYVFVIFLTLNEVQVSEEFELSGNIKLEVTKWGIGREREMLHRFNRLGQSAQKRDKSPAFSELGNRHQYYQWTVGQSVGTHLLCVILAAWTKLDGSFSLSSSWVKAINPACSSRLRFSATWLDKASALLCREPSRACASIVCLSVSSAIISFTQWESCSLADTLFTCIHAHRQVLSASNICFAFVWDDGKGGCTSVWVTAFSSCVIWVKTMSWLDRM